MSEFSLLASCHRRQNVCGDHPRDVSESPDDVTWWLVVLTSVVGVLASAIGRTTGELMISAPGESSNGVEKQDVMVQPFTGLLLVARSCYRGLKPTEAKGKPAKARTIDMSVSRELTLRRTRRVESAVHRLNL